MSEEKEVKRTRSRRASNTEASNGVQEEKNGQQTEEEVLVPYPHKLIRYTGAEKEGYAPTVNRYVYPKGRRVAVAEKQAIRILNMFSDQFEEVK